METKIKRMKIEERELREVIEKIFPLDVGFVKNQIIMSRIEGIFYLNVQSKKIFQINVRLTKLE
jgi:hypothetical protein